MSGRCVPDKPISEGAISCRSKLNRLPSSRVERLNTLDLIDCLSSSLLPV
jgi:hypothetical protein